MRILIAVDGSACSKAAVRFFASHLARNVGRDAQVDLLHVRIALPGYPEAVAAAAALQQIQETESEQLLDAAAAELRRVGIVANRRRADGSPAATIGRIADDEASLVVMGSHGHTAAGSLLFGSVSHGVIANCRTPVLIVRDKAPAGGTRGRKMRIGIAVDGSGHSLAAVRYLIDHRALFDADAEIALITVVPESVSGDASGFGEIAGPGSRQRPVEETRNELFDHATRSARQLVARHRLDWPVVRLVGDSPGDSIAAYAQDNELDLLVMGSRGHGALVSLAIGSVATRIAARCRTPLLVIRTAQDAERRRSVRRRLLGITARTPVAEGA